MGRELSLALIGVGGYGWYDVSAMPDRVRAAGRRLAGGVDPYPGGRACLPLVRAHGIPIYETVADLYARQPAPPDLVVVSSPIHLHAPHTIEALSHGSHVLCEKPLCVMPEQALEMMRAR